MKNKNPGILHLILRVLQGILIGVGAVLPGISGGVLCVVFGIYKPVMELLGSPFKRFKTHVPRLLPVIIGAAVGSSAWRKSSHFSWRNIRTLPYACLSD